MSNRRRISRRNTLQAVGALGATAWLGAHASGAKSREVAPPLPGRGHPAIFERVFQTPLIDTHEHLPDERDRLAGTSRGAIRVDDWSVLLSHYLDSDLLVAGMSRDDYGRFFSPETDPLAKWKYIEPFWPAVKNTGYGRAVRIALQQLYDVDELSAATVAQVQAGYESTRRPGFYRRILCDLAKIESCQVNAGPFRESEMPTLLMQDISFVGMFAGPQLDAYSQPAGIEVRTLSDWHRVIDWWYDKYGRFAVATKSQNAYVRDIDYERVPAEKVETIFSKRLAGEPLNPADQKAMEDHLFWYAVDKATEHQLPIKLHTGYYAGQDRMPLDRLRRNPASATDLCGRAPNSRFVFMHIGYPYYEEMIAVAKHYSNAYIDMCWSWIINPVASKDFLKKYLVTAPANKILPFGGDYVPVEPVLGHAWLARHGVALALSELVEENWLSLSDAMELIDPIMHGNARRLFDLEQKTRLLEHAPWS